MHPNKNFLNKANQTEERVPFIYRVLVKVGYHEDGFNFSSLSGAGEFMKTVILHTIDPENTEVTMQIVVPEPEEDKEEDKEENEDE